MSEVMRDIHSVYGKLYEGAVLTLASETRELGVYPLILSAVGSGRSSFSMLAQVVRRASLVKYIELLRALGSVERIVPAGRTHPEVRRRSTSSPTPTGTTGSRRSTRGGARPKSTELPMLMRSFWDATTPSGLSEWLGSRPLSFTGPS